MIGEKGEDCPSDRTVVGCKEAKILSQGKEKHSEFYSSRRGFCIEHWSSLSLRGQGGVEGCASRGWSGLPAEMLYWIGGLPRKLFQFCYFMVYISL